MRNAGLEEAQAGIKMPGEISITSDLQIGRKAHPLQLEIFSVPFRWRNHRPNSVFRFRSIYPSRVYLFTF